MNSQDSRLTCSDPCQVHGGLQTVVAGLFLYVVAWNIAGLKLEEYSVRHRLAWAREWWAAGHTGLPLMFRDYVVERMMGDFGWIGRVANLHQRWDMFYCVGPEERGWHVVVGTLEDGRQISPAAHQDIPKKGVRNCNTLNIPELIGCKSRRGEIFRSPL